MVITNYSEVEETELARLQKEVSAQAEALARRDAELHLLQNEVDAKTLALLQREAEVERLQGALAQCHVEMGRLQGQVATNSTELAHKDAEVGRLQDELLERTSAVAQKDNQVGQLQAELVEKASALEQKNVEVGGLKVKITSLVTKAISMDAESVDPMTSSVLQNAQDESSLLHLLKKDALKTCDVSMPKASILLGNLVLALVIVFSASLFASRLVSGLQHAGSWDRPGSQAEMTSSVEPPALSLVDGSDKFIRLETGMARMNAGLPQKVPKGTSLKERVQLINKSNFPYLQAKNPALAEKSEEMDCSHVGLRLSSGRRQRFSNYTV